MEGKEAREEGRKEGRRGGRSRSMEKVLSPSHRLSKEENENIMTERREEET